MSHAIADTIIIACQGLIGFCSGLKDGTNPRDHYLSHIYTGHLLVEPSLLWIGMLKI